MSTNDLNIIYHLKYFRYNMSFDLKLVRLRLSNLAGAVGFEPTSMVLETSILPLNYVPIKQFYCDPIGT